MRVSKCSSASPPLHGFAGQRLHPAAVAGDDACPQRRQVADCLAVDAELASCMADSVAVRARWSHSMAHAADPLGVLEPADQQLAVAPAVMQRLHRPTGAPRALNITRVQVPQQRRAQEEVGGVAAQHQQHRQRPERGVPKMGSVPRPCRSARRCRHTRHQREQDDDLVQRVRALAEEQAQRAPGQTAADRLTQCDAAPGGAAPAQPAAAARIEPESARARGHHQLGHQHAPGRARPGTESRIPQTDGRGPTIPEPTVSSDSS